MAVGIVAAIVGAWALFGAATQRLTGMGFALVAAPALVLTLGAGAAVPLVQALSFCVSASVFVSTFRDVEWKKALILLVPAYVGILPGWWVSENMPAPVLLILIGALVLLALVAMLASDRARIFKGGAGLASAGFLSGFMNVTAGVGGPAIVLYSLSNRWSHAAFVATIQVYFMGLNLGSLFAHGIPSMAAAIWISAFACLAVGILLGNLLARRVPTKAASRLVVVVALLGAVATIGQGLFQLLR